MNVALHLTEEQHERLLRILDDYGDDEQLAQWLAADIEGYDDESVGAQLAHDFGLAYQTEQALDMAHANHPAAADTAGKLAQWSREYGGDHGVTHTPEARVFARAAESADPGAIIMAHQQQGIELARTQPTGGTDRGSMLDAWNRQFGAPGPNHTQGNAEAVKRQQDRHRQAVADAGRRAGQLAEADELSLAGEAALADDAKRRLVAQDLVDLEQAGVDQGLLRQARPQLEAADPDRQAEILGVLRRTSAASNPGAWPNPAADQAARTTLGLGDGA